MATLAELERFRVVTHLLGVTRGKIERSQIRIILQKCLEDFFSCVQRPSFKSRAA